MEEAAKALVPMVNLLFHGVGALSKAFYDKYGKEALPIINEVMGQGGVEFGKIMQQMAPVKSMQVYGENFSRLGSMMGMGAEIVELSDDKLHFKVSQCPLGVEGTSRELCEALMATDRKMVETFLGQEVDMKVLKSVAAGDEKCEVIVTKK